MLELYEEPVQVLRLLTEKMRNIFSPKPDNDGLDNSAATGANAANAPEAVPTDSTVPDAATAVAGAQDAAFAALSNECIRMEKELAEHRENLLRRQAEFDNFRRRTERERAEFRVTATMETVASMLPVLDGLEAALKAPLSSGGAEIRKGVELVEKQMREILEKMGMSRLDALGKPFDPRVHHAVEMVPSDTHEHETVLDVYQQGYLFQDRLLRPAMVRVASPTNTGPTNTAPANTGPANTGPANTGPANTGAEQK
jgi:molecular chaperone GrpE